MSALPTRRYGNLLIHPALIRQDREMAHHRAPGSFVIEPIHTGWCTLTARFKVVGTSSDLTAFQHQLATITQGRFESSLSASLRYPGGALPSAEFQVKLRYHENDLSLQPLIQALTMPVPEEA